MATEDDRHRQERDIERHREETRDPHTRHERRTMDVVGVALTMLGLVIAGVVIHLAVAGLWVFFEHRSTAEDQRKQPVLSWTQTNQPPPLPPAPRLQPDPVGDLHQLRQSEDNVLQTYGWVDKNAGVVRIPVSRALAVLSQKGLPSWGGAAAAPGAKQAGTPATPPAKSGQGSPSGK